MYIDKNGTYNIKDVPVLKKQNFPNLEYLIINEKLKYNFYPIYEEIRTGTMNMISASAIKNMFCVKYVLVEDNTQGDICDLNCLELKLLKNRKNVIEVHPNVKILMMEDVTARKINFKLDLRVILNYGCARIKSLKMAHNGSVTYIKDCSFQFTFYKITSGNKFLSRY
jgi:hypothetical protein